MHAGLTKKPMAIESCALLADGYTPKKRGSYKKKKK